MLCGMLCGKPCVFYRREAMFTEYHVTQARTMLNLLHGVSVSLLKAGAEFDVLSRDDNANSHTVLIPPMSFC